MHAPRPQSESLRPAPPEPPSPWPLLTARMGALPPTTLDRDGHRLFNPAYLFYLESEKRVRWQRPEEVLDALGVAPGLVVADLGAGGGYFTERFARRVGSSGHVYATDVQDVMLAHLRRRIATQDLPNVTVVAAGYDRPGLPPRSCDLVFLSSVYKELTQRRRYMRRVARVLRPRGRVAILEYRPREAAHGPPEAMRLDVERIVAEMQSAGFTPVGDFDFLPRENFLVFGLAR